MIATPPLKKVTYAKKEKSKKFLVLLIRIGLIINVLVASLANLVLGPSLVTVSRRISSKIFIES